jgi:hypothetical protein
MEESAVAAHGGMAAETEGACEEIEQWEENAVIVRKIHEYRRIWADYPKNPLPMFRRGICTSDGD